MEQEQEQHRGVDPQLEQLKAAVTAALMLVDRALDLLRGALRVCEQASRHEGKHESEHERERSSYAASSGRDRALEMLERAGYPPNAVD